VSPKTDREVSHQIVPRRVGDLWVDPNVQRTLKKSRVNKMVGAFRPDALGVLTTSHRSDGTIHVVDGQHRYRTCESVGYTGIIQTNEYSGLTLPEEAALFRLLNTAEKPTRIDHYLIACVEQDPSAIGLAKFLAAHGWSVGPSAMEGRMSAIGSLERVYAFKPEVADATLAVLTGAWGHRPAAAQGVLVEGVGRLIFKYGIGAPGGIGGIDLDDLAKRLAKFPGGPDGLIGNARGQSVTRNGNVSIQVAKVIHGTYNERRRTTKLPPWE